MSTTGSSPADSSPKMEEPAMSSIYQPYTYLIGWSHLDKWYYGVRYAKNCTPSDLWNPYKTSSEYVKSFILEYGEPDIIQVRKIFKTTEMARRCEEKILDKVNAVKSSKWLNKGNAGRDFYPNMFGDNNPSKRSEVNEKKRLKLKNRSLIDLHGIDEANKIRIKMSKAKNGKFPNTSWRSSGFMWITNELLDCYIKRNEPIPNGFRLGRSSKTKENMKKPKTKKS